MTLNVVLMTAFYTLLYDSISLEVKYWFYYMYFAILTKAILLCQNMTTLNMNQVVTRLLQPCNNLVGVLSNS